ncbi:hypothetical protein L21SP2_1309 [Salinispira pacifica]|uniref:Uncharacterized protein n=1 Tax=Salinispira pacifica TaxID=1307761 RepID=V5WFY6_9SPIO|nr:hypothetical protein L21SP2_1309 [Salinispira pacifica]
MPPGAAQAILPVCSGGYRTFFITAPLLSNFSSFSPTSHPSPQLLILLPEFSSFPPRIRPEERVICAAWLVFS